MIMLYDEARTQIQELRNKIEQLRLAGALMANCLQHMRTAAPTEHQRKAIRMALNQWDTATFTPKK